MAGKVVDFLRNQPPDRPETDEAFGLRILRGAVAPPVDVERMLSSVRTLAPRRPLRGHWWRRVREALEVLASMGRVPADLPDGFPDEGPTFTGRVPGMPFDAFPRLDRLVHLDLPGRVGGHAAPALAAALVAEWLPLAARIQRSCALLAEAARAAARAPLDEGSDLGDVEVALAPLGLSEARWRWKAMSAAVSRAVPRARSLWGAWRRETLIGCEALGALDQIVQWESRGFAWASTPIPPGLDVEPDLWREMDDLVVGPVLAWRRLAAGRRRSLPRAYDTRYPSWAHLPNPFRATAELVSLGLLPSWISPDFRVVRVLLGPPESTVSALDQIPGWEGT